MAVWHILTKGEADRHTSVKRIAYKLYTLSHQLRAEHFEALGLTRRQYVRYQLMQLGVGDELEYVPWPGGIKRPLPPVAEVLALRPEMATA